MRITNNMGISTDPAMLSVDLESSLVPSPSVSTFLPEEDASTCPLLSTTPSPPPLAFSHPLTPNVDNTSNDSVNTEDNKVETSSSGGSSGIGMDVNDTAATTLFNKHAYQHLGKKADTTLQENVINANGTINIPITKDTPSFVTWNWPLIRKCTFFVFMSGLFAMCAVVVAMIITLPKTCNIKNAWYKGSVFYEIFPASFQDSNNDGVGDLPGIITRLDYLEALGVDVIRLNSIFPAKHYPEHFQNVTTFTKVADVLGSNKDLIQLVDSLHVRNMSLILDIPIHPFLSELDAHEMPIFENGNTTGSTIPLYNKDSIIVEAMRFWLSKGVDGFYMQGLENFYDDQHLVQNIIKWKSILGGDRILMVNHKLFQKLDDSKVKAIRDSIDIVDVYLDVTNGTTLIDKQIKALQSSLLGPSEYGPWIQWTLGGVTEQRLSRSLPANMTLAATVMQLMLPGTPSIFYGDEISLEEVDDPRNDHPDTKHLHHLSAMAWNSGRQFTSRDTLPWLPHGAKFTFRNLDEVAKMIQVRHKFPTVYQIGIIKDEHMVPNANVRHSRDDILIIERWYPRRNSFVAVSNFGDKHVKMDLTAMFYSGYPVIGRDPNTKIYFSDFEIDPMETIVVKLDK